MCGWRGQTSGGLLSAPLPAPVSAGGPGEVEAGQAETGGHQEAQEEGDLHSDRQVRHGVRIDENL